MESYTITDAEFALISKLVYDESGINLTESKKLLVIGRLGKRLRVLGLGSFREYYKYLKEAGPDEVTLMLDCISTNKTDFFRENGQFDFLRKEVLPGIVGSGKIRIWSAACSSGEEPYSIAMTLHESIPEIQGCDVKILASDISTKVLDTAMNGIYEADRLAPIPCDMVQRHFLLGTGDNSGKYKVKGHLRGMITYRRINLMEVPYPIKTTFDVIFFRNAMIYFDRKTQEDVINRISSYLKEGGYLFLGHSESLQGKNCNLAYIKPNTYRKI